MQVQMEALMEVDMEIFAQHESALSLQVFSNHLIVDKICETFSVENLKSIRQLCRGSYTASLKLWRSEAAVCLGPFAGWGRVSIQEFMGHVETSRNSSITSMKNFILEFCSLPPDHLTAPDLQRSAEYRFWNTFGPQMKHLHLKYCNFDQRKLINLICKLATNLECLVIESSQKVGSYGPLCEDKMRTQRSFKVLHVSGHLPFPNWQFLKYFPNLQEITLSKSTDKNLLEDVALIRKEDDGKTLNLKSIDLIRTHQSLESLIEAQLPLEHLSLRLDRDLPEHDLGNILQAHCATLQNLRLIRFPLPNWSPLSFSPLHQNFSSLRELHLWGNVVSSFNFLKWTPSLKKLEVDLLCYDKAFDIYNWSPLGPRQPIQPNYEDMVKASHILMETENFEHLQLESFQMDYAFGQESLSKLKKWMPKLKTFKSILNDDTLRLVCHKWRDLKGLKLMFGSEVTDEGIIANLPHLHDLMNFEVESYCDTSRISDTSGTHAFLKMPQLKHLRVCVSEQMTADTEMLVKNRIPDALLLRNYGDHHSHLPIDCCRRVSFYYDNLQLNA